MVKDDNTVTARPVTVAHSENDESAITSGLAAGDKVVVEGQVRLKNGAQVKVTSSAGGEHVATATDATAPDAIVTDPSKTSLSGKYKKP